MKLLCDEMLAGLARWLRAAGHDVEQGSPRTRDRELLARAEAEGRVFLTRDRSVPQIKRCVVDNTPLEPATAEDLARMPEESRILPGPHKACPACRRVYWPGSHVRRMQARLEQWAA